MISREGGREEDVGFSVVEFRSAFDFVASATAALRSGISSITANAESIAATTMNAAAAAATINAAGGRRRSEGGLEGGVVGRSERGSADGVLRGSGGAASAGRRPEGGVVPFGAGSGAEATGTPELGGQIELGAMKKNPVCTLSYS